ncbi:hypothetical protein T484DRAFT_1816696 [Baffinella frigidus]|nr:hypothetical protein T484DRAFT_1816696 [Cryptophyta sp. CCMP2293]
MDGDKVPVPHFGLVLPEEEFHALATRVEAAASRVPFLIRPCLRFQGAPAEQC